MYLDWLRDLIQEPEVGLLLTGRNDGIAQVGGTCPSQGMVLT